MLLRSCTLLALAILLPTVRAWGQAAAEYAGATSRMGATAAQVGPPKKLEVLPASQGKAENKRDLVHLPASTEEPPEVRNRRDLEENAGPEAAKLMLRSVPTGAQVRVDGKIVGTTPLLLVLPPGAYQVEMSGARMQHGETKVDLLPRESREVVLSLQSRYPTSVRLPKRRDSVTQR